MRIFEIKPTKKTIPWLRRHRINLTALQNALSILYTEIKPQNDFRRLLLHCKQIFVVILAGISLVLTKFIYVVSLIFMKKAENKKYLLYFFIFFMNLGIGCNPKF